MAGSDMVRYAGGSVGGKVVPAARAYGGSPELAAATRERVVELARRLDYLAPPGPTGAPGPPGVRTRAIGVLLPYVSRWFFAQVLSGIEQEVRRAEYDLLLYGVHGPAALHRFFDELPFRGRVDGLLVVALPVGARELAALGELAVPVELVAARRPGLPGIRIDDAAAARLAVRHLTGLGHRRIAFIGGAADDPLGFAAPVERRTGYLAQLAADGLPAPAELAVAGRFTASGGQQATDRLLGLPEPPTAMFAASDEMALGALRVARRRGLRVPADLSIVGFDDHELAAAADLTTVSQPAARQGREAAQALLAELAAGPGGPARPDLVLEARLVVRGSTGPPGPRVFGPG